MPTKLKMRWFIVVRRWGLRSVTTIAVVGLVQLAILGVVSIKLIQRSFAAAEISQQAVVASHAQIDRLNLIFQLLIDAESGGRGFFITGNPVFLETYVEATPRIEAELRYFAGSNDPDVILFGQTIKNKLMFIADIIEVRRRDGLTIAVERVSSQRGKLLMDAARSQLAKVYGRARERLAARLQAQIRATDASKRIILTVLAMSQLLSIAVVILLIFYYRKRRDTERVSRRRAAMLGATLENVEIGIVLLDSNGEVIDHNARFDVLTTAGASADTLAVDTRALEAALQREAVHFDYVNNDGIAVDVRGQPAAEDLYVLTYTDISEQRRNDQLKNDFVSTVSHELRTPLTAIRGALGLLAGPLTAGLPSKALVLLEVADRNAARLTALVNDLLDIDKIEAGLMTLELAPIDMNTLALEAAEANRSFAAQRGVSLAVGTSSQPVTVHADGTRIHQVITNLISNAAKFSPQNGIVTITVEQTAHTARLSVHDQGEGIPAEFRSRIFGKFAQAASGDAKRMNGSGLGLSISRAIIDQHAGKLEFESQPGKTVFHFSLARLIHEPYL